VHLVGFLFIVVIYVLLYHKRPKSGSHSRFKSSESVNFSENFVLPGHYAVYVGNCTPTLQESLTKNKIYFTRKSGEDFQELSLLNYSVVKCWILFFSSPNFEVELKFYGKKGTPKRIKRHIKLKELRNEKMFYRELNFKNRASYIQDGRTATLQTLHLIYIFQQI
jgi:hypothetical protein